MQLCIKFDFFISSYNKALALSILVYLELPLAISGYLGLSLAILGYLRLSFAIIRYPSYIRLSHAFFF